MAYQTDNGTRTFIDPLPQPTPGSNHQSQRLPASTSPADGPPLPADELPPGAHDDILTQDTRRLAELIKDLRIAMLMTFPPPVQHAPPPNPTATSTPNPQPPHATPGVAPPAHTEATAGIAAATTAGYIDDAATAGPGPSHTPFHMGPAFVNGQHPEHPQQQHQQNPPQNYGYRANSRVHARPMYTLPLNPAAFDGDLWFMASTLGSAVQEICTGTASSHAGHAPNHGQPVVLTYSDDHKNRYVVVYGTATCEVNPAKAKELWNIHAQGRWPGGPEDPSLTLIRVRAHTAEYWDGPSNASYMMSLLKAVMKGQRLEDKSDHAQVRVD